MEFLNWLETNGFSNWVLTTSWVYPWVIAFHSIGMGFLVGVVSMIGLRILGFGSFPVAPLSKFLLIVRIAFVLNVATGLIMFVIDAQQFFFSPTFRVKMLLVALGIVTGWLLSTQVFGDKATWDGQGNAPQSVRLIAGASVVCWVGAIVAGRLTAYLP
ncbi:MAG: hypothetical protein PVF63_04510 [Gammaproteobacteria bacterium]|jgi:hypothetical protein